ncbi:CHASE2 domain-containing protein [Leeia aquatica]|uniref:histidine kinase n=1 Tax=Leeia aquatica TaxID=2725557 RepID=A0A847SK52_9NEIS|nr:CHASE2 domain-containing protein [Leeia aquatica]NLR76302.1 CHASE2 domain-containing protein [Leeia aquatica]
MIRLWPRWGGHRAGWSLLLREWLLSLLLMGGLVGWLGWQNGLGRLDQTLYDGLLPQLQRSARPDITLVTLDDASIHVLGRWPWRRAVLAALLSRTTQARVVGLDVILSEPDLNQPLDDVLLAEAMRQHGKVILPVVLSQRGGQLELLEPIPLLQRAAAGQGHIHLELDPDGLARSVYLQEGFAKQTYPHLTLAMLQWAGHKPDRIPGMRRPEGGAAPGVWQRDYWMQVPFAGPVGHFRQVSALDVLQGRVDPASFRDQYVLIGASAVGLGDAYPTPVSGTSRAMPGVEVMANVLDSLLGGQRLERVTPLWSMLFALLPLLLAYVAFLSLSPRWILLTTVALALAVLLATVWLMRAGWWLPPSAALIGLGIAYPAWSWRRLEAALRYLGEAFERLRDEPQPFGLVDAAPEQLTTVLDQRIMLVRQAMERAADWRRLVFDGLNSLPDATLITDAAGTILLANQAAARRFEAALTEPLPGRHLAHLLLPLQPQEASNILAWLDLLDPGKIAEVADGIEVGAGDGSRLLVKCAPFFNARRELNGWIVNLVDISSLRQAERGRDDALRFLSHDMRSPQASILALIELQRSPGRALPQEEFLQRLAQYAGRALGLAENFVQLARAEAQQYHFAEENLSELLLDALDELWVNAQEKGVTLVQPDTHPEAPVLADRVLLTRVLINLLSNAIKYSPAGTSVFSQIHYEGGWWWCSIRDQGYGIPPERQAELFQRFKRFRTSGQPEEEGVGLGLAFVKTVLDRHGGIIEVDSTVGQGTTFRFALMSAAGADTGETAIAPPAAWTEQARMDDADSSTG